METEAFTCIYPFGNDLTLQYYFSFRCMEGPLMKSEGSHDYEWSENLGSSLITERPGAILGYSTSHWENLSITSKWPWVVGEMKGKTTSAQKGSPSCMKWIWHSWEWKKLASFSLWFMDFFVACWVREDGQQMTGTATLKVAKCYIKLPLEILSSPNVTRFVPISQTVSQTTR